MNPAWWLRLRTLGRTGEITVPPDNFFVLGDNRNNSEDSRYLGFIPRKAVVGKPIVVYFSLRAAGRRGREPYAPLSARICWSRPAPALGSCHAQP